MSEAISNLSQTVFFNPLRSVGFIVPNCAVEERHSDRLQVTQNPVEIGAMISDHAFLLPFGVTLRYGWSDSSTGVSQSSQFAYQALQQLQQSREPFTVVTGKRMYENMVLLEMEVTTDSHTENVLMATLHCQTVIIVSTSSVPANSAPQADQAMPQSTAPTVSVGQQQLAPPTATPGLVGLNTGGSAP